MARTDEATTAPARAVAPSLLLGLVLGVAAAVRLGLLLQEWPASNSDEATTGLMAMHIAEGRELPSYMYGQSYMGTLEAYAAALVYRVSRPSLLGLRLPMLAMFLVFLGLLHLLARRLYGTAVALVSVGLLALGSRELYGHQLVAQGAIPETLIAGTVLLLVGHRLLEASDGTGGVGGVAAERRLLAGWGATATLGLWSTVLVAPFVLTSAVLVGLALRRRTPPPGGRLWALGGGLLLGAAPWLAHDLTRPWRDSSVVAVLGAYLDGGTGLTEPSAGPVAQVTNTVTTSLAYVTGGSALAHPSSPPAWPFGYSGSWQPPTDDVVATLWGLGLVVLWAVAVAQGVRLLRGRRVSTSWRPAAAAASSVAVTRLAMLAAAGLTVLAFAASPTPGSAPANNARYLVGILVATPAVVAPLWALPRLAARLLPGTGLTRRSGLRLGRAVRAAVLAVVTTSLVLGTTQAYRDAARGPSEASSRALAEALQRRGIGHVYGGYLDCNRLTFLSRERVTCAVLAQDATGALVPGFDRYLPYRSAVRRDPAAAYVFRTGDPRLAVLAGSTCRWVDRWLVAGYEVWQPADGCAVVADASG